jgi:hypothetical protein
MRRTLTLAAVAAFGLLLMAGDASACHKKKCKTPCATVACAPCPPKKKCGLLGGLCGKKKAHCAPAPCAMPVTVAVIHTPVYHHPYGPMPSMQAPPVPAKQTP